MIFFFAWEVRSFEFADLFPTLTAPVWIPYMLFTSVFSRLFGAGLAAFSGSELKLYAIFVLVFVIIFLVVRRVRTA